MTTVAVGSDYFRFRTYPSHYNAWRRHRRTLSHHLDGTARNWRRRGVPDPEAAASTPWVAKGLDSRSKYFVPPQAMVLRDHPQPGMRPLDDLPVYCETARDDHLLQSLAPALTTAGSLPSVRKPFHGTLVGPAGTRFGAVAMVSRMPRLTHHDSIRLADPWSVADDPGPRLASRTTKSPGQTRCYGLTRLWFDSLLPPEQRERSWVIADWQTIDNLAGIVWVKVQRSQSPCDVPWRVARELFDIADLDREKQAEDFSRRSTVFKGTEKSYQVLENCPAVVNLWCKELDTKAQLRVKFVVQANGYASTSLDRAGERVVNSPELTRSLEGPIALTMAERAE